MGNRLIVRYLRVMRWGDEEGYVSQVLDVLVQARRRGPQANPRV